MSSIFVTIVLAIAVFASPSSAKCRSGISKGTMGAARIVYTGGPGFDPAPVLAENMLRNFVLIQSKECIAEHREWVARAPWGQDFKDLFAQVIRWQRETLAKGAAHIYRLSHEYRKRPDASANAFDALSYILLRRAAEMGHAEAKAELPNRRHPVDEPKFRAELLAKTFAKAKRNDVRAQIYMGQEYLISRHIEIDPVKAYYWFSRAKANGRDISAYLPHLQKVLSPADRERVREWIDKGIVPGL